MNTFDEDQRGDEVAAESAKWYPYKNQSWMKRLGHRLYGVYLFVAASVSPPLIRTRERLRDELSKASDDLAPIEESYERMLSSTRQPPVKLNPAFRRARLAYERGDVESFWRHLYTIREWELRAIDEIQHVEYDDFDEINIEIPTLEDKALSVLGEARGNLSPERFERVEELLCEDEQIRTGLHRDHVLAAIQILYERYVKDHTEGFTLRALETQFLTFITTTLLSILAILYIFWVNSFPADDVSYMFVEWEDVTVYVNIMTEPSFFLLIVWFGVLGASVSGLLSLSDVLKRASVPEQQGHFSLAIGRLVVGAAGALILHIFLLAGILDLALKVDVTPSTALVVAFFGGFSERILRRAVENVAGSETAPPTRSV